MKAVSNFRYWVLLSDPRTATDRIVGGADSFEAARQEAKRLNADLNRTAGVPTTAPFPVFYARHKNGHIPTDPQFRFVMDYLDREEVAG